jgi:hypothetical protein
MKIKIILLILIISIFLTGCGIYGKGNITGYPTGVEEGFFWNKVYIKSALDSSKEDCFVINKNSNLYNEITQMAKENQKGYFDYNRHFWTAASECYNDEIIKVEIK